ncbi:MAG: class I SAM-dependent methyltransferase [Methanomicrobiales archaeon]|jgi:tRNA (guanine37-N1)-methyltransferase|nr:methyltransferase domain-containing protein [Burkholderiaceae bacterium]NLH26675.1 methyltransferase domain-containing protein [Methanomicrobiales archaeon]HNB02908.1 methyltransferase domain-containing protein [Methanoregulaceae archaeon]HNJ81515.1 methyltransferase domain-containing protein [Methanoregulaceae archaeon]HNW80377.1 methyltransferase domain-containing protein [Methanoregulaceae archaeon]
MEQEQWTVRVPLGRGEEMRQELIRAGILDREKRPRTDGESLLLPVTTWIEGAERALFESRNPLPELPRHELIGGIAIMLTHDPAAAEQLLTLRSSLHTVLFPLSDVEGKYRTRRFEVLAGRQGTHTRCLEYGYRFEIDLSEAYFSPRLATERQRIVGLQNEGEHVIDMFAGIGPFAIVLARKAGYVLGVDINPAAIRLMVRNLNLNHADNVIPMLADAYHLPDLVSWTFDRVIMNHPTASIAFLPQGFRLCKPGGSIHLYLIQSYESEALAALQDYPVAEITERVVRSYSPGRWHAVYDIRKKS